MQTSESQSNAEPLQILLVEDEPEIAGPLAEVLSEQGHCVRVEHDGGRGLSQLKHNLFDLMISDIRLPTVDGLELFDWVQHHRPSTAVVLMSAYGSVPEAVSAIRQDAVHYLHKPFELDELLGTVEEVAERLVLSGARGAEGDPQNPVEALLIGRSAAMRAAKSRIRATAGSDAPVFIHGETGTGKELAARAIHATSSRSQGPFVAVNCGALPENLVESELFGHLRGAFTGAVQSREGHFASASGGTLFLDEVTEMSPQCQVKLMRVLQEGTLQPVGSDKLVRVDVRVLAATNRNLRELLQGGRFREDLFYRLRVLDVHMPALRERKDDLPLLVRHFLKKYSSASDSARGISAYAWALLRRYAFPGNVRELEHIIQHALVLSAGGQIEAGHLPLEVSGASDASKSERPSLSEAVAEFEQEFILRTLDEVNWNKRHAADRLGISRKNLWEKLKRMESKPG